MPLRVQHFYDGRAEVRFGVIEIPVNKPAWIERAFIMGFRLDPETDRPYDLGQIRAMAAGQPVVATEPQAPESTESAGEDVEGTDDGGQSPSEDGVRESELPGDDGVPEAGMGSGDSGSTDDDASGEPAE